MRANKTLIITPLLTLAACVSLSPKEEAQYRHIHADMPIPYAYEDDLFEEGVDDIASMGAFALMGARIGWPESFTRSSPQHGLHDRRCCFAAGRTAADAGPSDELLQSP